MCPFSNIEEIKYLVNFVTKAFQKRRHLKYFNDEIKKVKGYPVMTF